MNFIFLAGRNTPLTDARPGSGARGGGPSRPGSSNSGRPLTAPPAEEILPLQMAKKDPLPPILTKDDDDDDDVEETYIEIEATEATSDIIGE